MVVNHVIISHHSSTKIGLAFSSGLAAINTIYFNFIKSGENMVCADDVSITAESLHRHSKDTAQQCVFVTKNSLQFVSRRA